MELVRLRLRVREDSAIRLQNLSTFLAKSPAECARRSILFGKFIFDEITSGSSLYTAAHGDERAQAGPAIIPPPLFDQPARLGAEMQLNFLPHTVDTLADLVLEAQVSIELALSWCIDVVTLFYHEAETKTLHLRRANGEHAVIGLSKA